MARAPQSYSEAVGQAQALLRDARLNDPDEHFPYKHADVAALVAQNPPMGPDGPEDDRARAEDFISQDIADRSAAYVQAQADYLADPGDATKAGLDDARGALVAARQAHREHRHQGFTVVGIRARRAGE